MRVDGLYSTHNKEWGTMPSTQHVQSTGSHLVPFIRDTSISHINLPNSHFAPVYGKLKHFTPEVTKTEVSLKVKWLIFRYLTI
jgi:hypothetical protein